MAITTSWSPPSSSAHPHVEAARAASKSVLRRWARDVDERNRFPAESVQALRDAGLLGFFVPDRLGGQPGDFATYAHIAAILGEECLSSALIWAMHCQQVLILADHASTEHSDVLASIAREGALVASVTSEFEKGADLLRAHAPLVPDGPQFVVRRRAPVVSYGAEAKYYLMTMRAGAERPKHDVRLVLVTPADGEISVLGEWNAMGMRATRSVSMTFDARVGPSRFIGDSFRHVALQSMVPAGHVGWTACWFGAARGAFNRFIHRLRPMAAKGQRDLTSKLLLSRLAEHRLTLDLIEAALGQATNRLDQLRRSSAPLDEYEDITHNIALNNLKVIGSRLAFSVANGLVELSGLAQGYMKDDPDALERVFRDLRAASLMFHNDRLLDVNGKLILVEHSPMRAVWQGRLRDESSNRRSP